MKVDKPQVLSLLYRPYLLRSQWRLSVTTLAGFSLTEPRKLVGEQAMWPAVAEATGGVTWDEGLPKFRGEALLFGRCHTPDHIPRPIVSVSLQVGSLSKRLAVIGPRTWDSGAFTEPEPFTEMALDWDHAFGGPAFAKNPRGKGIAEQTSQDGKGTFLLPNVEYPERLIRSRRDKPEPASFMPMEVTWPQRAAKAGTYGKQYLERDFPGLAADVHPDFFQLAPSDQWINGFWQGNEKYLLDKLHPTKSRLEGELPGIRVRAFAGLRGGAPFQEVGMRLETLVFLPERDLGLMVFRGYFDIQEDDAADVEALFVASESLGSPRPADHYVAAFRRRLDKDGDPLAALDESDLVPDFAAAPPPKLPFPSSEELQAMREERLAAAKRQLSQQGFDADAVLAHVAPTPMPTTPAELERMEADLEKSFASFRAEAEKQMATRGETVEASGGPPQPMAERTLAMLDPQELAAKPELRQQLGDADAQMLDGYRQMAHRMGPARLLGADASGARREALLEAYRAGKSLAGTDWTGCALSSIELRGADLERALMQSVDLTHADLSGADLRGAVLAHARLDQATLEGCNAEGANFGAAHVHGTRFDQAKLRSALFEEMQIRNASFRGADLTEASLLGTSIEGACFDEAVAPGIVLMKLSLRGSSFARAQLLKASFLQTEMQGVDFSGANLELVTFVTVKADGANFAGADVRGVHAVAGCSFVGASFAGANLENAFLRGANLEGASFEGACLKGADLSECRLTGARLSRAQAKEALFVRANLDHARLEQVNLMQSLMRKASLRGTVLSGSNLFASDLGQIRLDEKTKLDGCNLKRVLIHPKVRRP